jgi:GNAT superfamily N-acetyltransferase
MPTMHWIRVEEIASLVHIPPGYRLEQLKRSDIPELVSRLSAWYPEIAVGAGSCYLRDEFYDREVYWEGELQRDVLVVVIRRNQELAGMFSVELNPDTLTLFGPLQAIAPEHRGAKLGSIAIAFCEAMGRAMGVGLVYYYATLQIPHTQLAGEKAGYQLVGIVPALDRDLVEPGVVKYVYEAIYAKVLAADNDILRPDSACLTPRTRALLDFLFTK